MQAKGGRRGLFIALGAAAVLALSCVACVLFFVLFPRTSREAPEAVPLPELRGAYRTDATVGAYDRSWVTFDAWVAGSGTGEHGTFITLEEQPSASRPPGIRAPLVHCRPGAVPPPPDEARVQVVARVRGLEHAPGLGTGSPFRWLVLEPCSFTSIAP